MDIMAIITCFIICFLYLAYQHHQHTVEKEMKKAHDARVLANTIEMRTKAGKKLLQYADFCQSRAPIRFDNGTTLFIDDNSKRIAVEDPTTLIIVSYGNIIGYNLKEDHRTVLESNTDAALGGAIVGDLLLGDAATGAIVGASGSRKMSNICSSMTLGFKLDDIQHPYIEFSLICSDIDKNSSTYAQARHWAGEAIALLSIVERQQKAGALPKDDLIIFSLFQNSNMWQPYYGKTPKLNIGRLTLCPNCFAPMYYAADQCHACGYNLACETTENTNKLACGTILKGKYYVGKCLGHNETSITYLGFDIELNTKVFIKEYFPIGIASRSEGKVAVICSDTESTNVFLFQRGMNEFVLEAKTLCNFISPSIGRVLESFACNGTEYMIMEHFVGKPLSEYLVEHGGKLAFTETHKLLLPIVHVLSDIHTKGLVFNELNPDNIFILKDGKTKLFDLGIGKLKVQSVQYHNRHIKLIKGYTPPELYREDGQIGKWSDVYSIAAVFYRCLTGEEPQEAMDRLLNDKISDIYAKVSPDTPQNAINAIIKAMSLNKEERFKNIEEFRNAIC